MDVVSTVRSILQGIHDLKERAELAKTNREACKDLAARVEYLCPILMDGNLQSKTGFELIAQKINAFVSDVGKFVQMLLPPARKGTKKKGVFAAAKGAVMSAAQAGMHLAEEIRTNSRNAAAILEYDRKLTQLLSDLQVLVATSSHLHISPALPSEVLAKAAIDLRNYLVMQVNSVMTQVADGHSLPADIESLPACADAVEQEIHDLATQMCVSSTDLPSEATAEATKQLKAFVAKQVGDIRSVSQMLRSQQVDTAPAFPADEDISEAFVSCGGPNNDRLGEVGGFGVTFKRRYQPTGKVYALKEINVEHAVRMGLDEDRLLTEAETLHKISHRHVVRCHHSFFSEDGVRFFLVMELVDGLTLDQVLKASGYQPSPPLLAKWLQQLARALVYMHEDCHIVHRDLKPANVMVTRGMEDIKIIDFGMARLVPAGAAAAAMTARVGTLFYMSWAKKHGEKYDGRDDVWAVGCMLLELLFGVSMAAQQSLCDEDAGRARHLQTAKQVHAGLGGVLNQVLARKENDAIPFATQLLMLASDDQVLTKSAVSALMEDGHDLSAVSSSASKTPETSSAFDKPISSKFTKDAAKANLVAWLVEYVSGFTEEDAEECASRCLALKYNTIALLGKEYALCKEEGAAVDDLLSSVVTARPLRRELQEALEKAFCPVSLNYATQPSLSSTDANVTKKVCIFSSNEALKQALDMWCKRDTITRAEVESLYGHISTWDTSRITSMKELFKDKSDFNDDISHWDVSNVTDMSHMFHNASGFNHPIGSWNVSKVTNMSGMFNGATSFNRPIGSWNVSNVTNMKSMFYGATSFNQPVGSWDVRNVTDLSRMFQNAASFNQPLGSWDVSQATDMKSMFYCSEAFNQPIESWNVSKVTDMSRMFQNATSFNRPVGSWDVSQVTDMRCMFYGAASFNQPIGSWDVTKVTDLSRMFQNATSFNQPLGSWTISKGTVMTMFVSTSYEHPLPTSK